MTLPKIIENFQRLAESGMFTDESRYDIAFTEDLICRARAQALFQYYQKTKKINPNCTQQFVAKYDADIQESDRFVKFECPDFITLDDRVDGLFYVGTVDGNCAYRKVGSRAALANSNKHRYTKTTDEINKFIYSDGYIEVYGNTLLKELRVDGIFTTPTKIPTYNKRLDEFPIDQALIPIMQQIIFKSEIGIELSEPAKIKNQETSK